MSNAQVSRAIDEIKRALESEDPEFMRRFQAIRRAEIARIITVVTLLASSAALLAVGLATLSWVAWCAGVVAFLAAAAVDQRYKRAMRRTAGRRDGH